MSRDGDNDVQERIRAASFAARDADLGDLDINPDPSAVAARLHGYGLRIGKCEAQIEMLLAIIGERDNERSSGAECSGSGRARGSGGDGSGGNGDG